MRHVTRTHNERKMDTAVAPVRHNDTGLIHTQPLASSVKPPFLYCDESRTIFRQRSPREAKATQSCDFSERAGADR